MDELNLAVSITTPTYITTGSTSTIAGSEIMAIVNINTANAETVQPASEESMESPKAEPPSRISIDQVLETLEKEIKRWYDSLKNRDFDQYLQDN
jgi:hypothetical protein